MAIPQQPASTAPQQPALPRPDMFDVLPALHELLARIDHRSPSLGGDPAPTGPVPSASISSSSSEDDGAAYAELAPLEPRDLPTEALAIKAKIRRALREVEKLPDMERSVEEQRREIEDLEDRIARQRQTLRKLGEVARAMAG